MNKNVKQLPIYNAVMDQKVIHDIITVEMWESTQGNYLHKKNINNVQHSTASIVTLLLEERYQE
ncbi:MAG TPA: hypothetical protein PKD85_10935, partial [Saprospiraceae bacterium]|nr:hypothetical protein [Saprospiraceae bacterium]